MMDFFMVSTRVGKNGLVEIYPRFIIPTKRKSSDLMIRGGDFYAVWQSDKNLWSTEEGDALAMIDHELDLYYEEHKESYEKVRVLHMWDAQSGMIDLWHKYCKQQLRDSYHPLDEKIIFSNTECKKEDYASKRLDYPLVEGSIEAYDKLLSTLYSEEERHKIEWAIGSIVSGDSKKLQKFIVLHGDRGTGKSTVLNIIEAMFKGYTTAFDAKSLGSANAQFALEPFRDNPLVGIQQDGDLSRIEDNTRLNSLVSHESMSVNEKYAKAYVSQFKCFLFMGTNKPVKITDAKSGILRRLIDVTPTGNKIPYREYNRLTKQVKFEYGAIAKHCLDVYLEDPDAYENYIPLGMMATTNDFYNFMIDSYNIFLKEDGVPLKQAWEMYKVYCEEARVAYPFSKMKFQDELSNYFREVKHRIRLEDGSRPATYYSGFRTDRFEDSEEETEVKQTSEEQLDDIWLKFDCTTSIFDELYSDCQAQYANEDEIPVTSWDKCQTKLSDIDTSKLHFVKPQDKDPYHIVIDFDLKNESKEKDFIKNFEAACQWPATYAELSKSGCGIHLHYIYVGDVSKLKPEYAPNIEVKTFPGKAPLRRKVTRCNNLPIAMLYSGLPKKEVKMLSSKTVKNEKELRYKIAKNLNKGYLGYTKPSIQFINHLLDEAYESGIEYNVSDMRGDIFNFASGSNNNAAYCTKLVTKMKFMSKDYSPDTPHDPADESLPIIFYDIEVFPNLVVVCWKFEGDNHPVMAMVNPTASQIESWRHTGRLIDFNGKNYDRYILFAISIGWSVEQIYQLSRDIIVNGKRNEHFSQAGKFGYADIYDFSSKKQSLKKFEIELGIHHQELGLDWNKPVPEHLWDTVVDYCKNDVIATEAVFHSKDRQADFLARKILADLAGMPVDTRTNTLTAEWIFGNDKNPQSQFLYRDLSKPVTKLDPEVMQYLKDYNLPTSFTAYDGTKSILPFFPGYSNFAGRSTYRGLEFGEGGYVSVKEGMWYDVWDEDVSGQHPSTIRINCLFGPKYTRRYNDIVDARVLIKHGNYEAAKKLMDGKLAKYLDDPSSAEALSSALKIAVNSVYGLTFAKFPNRFRDPRNKDNIVAKMGELFMIDLMHRVEEKGFDVIHIKTDSIKIPKATTELIDFVWSFGKSYGYNFEHEFHFDRICLVNKAAFIAKVSDREDINGRKSGTWYPKATQFQTPYVLKTLFTHEDICFEDMCEFKSVTQGSIYLDMNEKLPDVSEYEKELAKSTMMHHDGIISHSEYEEIKARFEPLIEAGHSYQFVGRVGSFCPIKKGSGGGRLIRMVDGKPYAVNGTKGYRWLESETVAKLNMKNDIDVWYYDKLVEDARNAVSKYGDFDAFVNGDPLAPYMNVPETEHEEIPFSA